MVITKCVQGKITKVTPTLVGTECEKTTYSNQAFVTTWRQFQIAIDSLRKFSVPRAYFLPNMLE